MLRLVRPAKSDNANHVSTIGPWGRELYIGKEVVEAEDVEVNRNREPKKILRPLSPTRVDLADHELLHFNYRSSCPNCVWGKGHSKHHRVSTDGPK